jgi:chromosome partitioning protein
LKQALDLLRDGYDFLLVDCPPSLGLLTLNGLCAADEVLIPIQCEYFALEGVTDLLETIERVKITLNPMLVIGGVLLTMYDERTNLSHQVAEDIRAHFGDRVFKTVIPRSVRLAEAPSFGKSIIAYDIKSKGAEAYLNLAAEVLAR